MRIKVSSIKRKEGLKQALKKGESMDSVHNALI